MLNNLEVWRFALESPENLPSTAVNFVWFPGLYERLTSSAPVQICPYFSDFNFTNWDSRDQVTTVKEFVTQQMCSQS